MINNLVGTIVTKTQKNLTMNWKVVKESVPDRLPEVAEYRDTLQSKIGFKKLLEFLHKYGYEEGSCSFESCTSSNVDRKPLDQKKSIIFAELFLTLMYKNWEDKLQKMNRYVEEYNNQNGNKTIKVFDKTEFLIGYALIIGAACYYQSGNILFNNGKEQDNT